MKSKGCWEYRKSYLLQRSIPCKACHLSIDTVVHAVPLSLSPCMLRIAWTVSCKQGDSKADRRQVEMVRGS